MYNTIYIRQTTVTVIIQIETQNSRFKNKLLRPLPSHLGFTNPGVHPHTFGAMHVPPFLHPTPPKHTAKSTIALNKISFIHRCKKGGPKVNLDTLSLK